MEALVVYLIHFSTSSRMHTSVILMAARIVVSQVSITKYVLATRSVIKVEINGLRAFQNEMSAFRNGGGLWTKQ